MEAEKAPAPARHASRRPPLPGWVPPVCAVLFGTALALQYPGALGASLAAPLIGLALALTAWALLTRVRARRGIPRRGVPAWALSVTAACAALALDSADTAHSGAIHLAAGAFAAVLVWYRLRSRAAG
ncbi:hypothetical protein [Streptomyces sp. NPDC006684]|uniref:hypothetical protein n=1 Tax=unclassified Streptomyces TaxID=2593676 RepID=UPI003452E8DF